MRDLVLSSAGYYTCEASTEAPRFRTVNGQGQLRIVRPPDSKPLLTGNDPRGYRVGNYVRMNCTSPNSMPPATLRFYVNNERVGEHQVRRFPPFKSDAGLYTPTLALKLRLRREHFQNRHVEIKCTATIFSQFFESSVLVLPGIGLEEIALESRGGSTSKAGQGKWMAESL